MSNKIQSLAAQKREAIKKSKESKDEKVQAIYRQVASQFDAKIEKLKAAQRLRAAKMRHGMTESEKQKQAAHDLLLEESAELLRDAKTASIPWRFGYYKAAAESLRAANAIKGVA